MQKESIDLAAGSSYLPNKQSQVNQINFSLQNINKLVLKFDKSSKKVPFQQMHSKEVDRLPTIQLKSNNKVLVKYQYNTYTIVCDERQCHLLSQIVICNPNFQTIFYQLIKQFLTNTQTVPIEQNIEKIVKKLLLASQQWYKFKSAFEYKFKQKFKLDDHVLIQNSLQQKQKESFSYLTDIQKEKKLIKIIMRHPKYLEIFNQKIQKNIRKQQEKLLFIHNLDGQVEVISVNKIAFQQLQAHLRSGLRYYYHFEAFLSASIQQKNILLTASQLASHLLVNLLGHQFNLILIQLIKNLKIRLPEQKQHILLQNYLTKYEKYQQVYSKINKSIKISRKKIQKYTYQLQQQISCQNNQKFLQQKEKINKLYAQSFTKYQNQFNNEKQQNSQLIKNIFFSIFQIFKRYILEKQTLKRINIQLEQKYPNEKRQKVLQLKYLLEFLVVLKNGLFSKKVVNQPIFYMMKDSFNSDSHLQKQKDQKKLTDINIKIDKSNFSPQSYISSISRCSDSRINRSNKQYQVSGNCQLISNLDSIYNIQQTKDQQKSLNSSSGPIYQSSFLNSTFIKLSSNFSKYQYPENFIQRQCNDSFRADLIQFQQIQTSRQYVELFKLFIYILSNIHNLLQNIELKQFLKIIKFKSLGVQQMNRMQIRYPNEVFKHQQNKERKISLEIIIQVNQEYKALSSTKSSSLNNLTKQETIQRKNKITSGITNAHKNFAQEVSKKPLEAVGKGRQFLSKKKNIA